MANDNLKILQQVVKNEKDQQEPVSYDVSLTGNQVLFEDKDDEQNNIYVKAQSLYDYLKNYFSKKMFTLESENHPDTANNENGNDNIVIWNDTGFEDRFTAYLTKNNIDISDPSYDREAKLVEFEAKDNKRNINENNQENDG